jgi:hypothetical protein
MAMSGRFKWLLKTMCLNLEIDESEIDCSLSYWENKMNIEQAFQVKLGLVHFGQSSSDEDKYQKYAKYYAGAN